MPRHTADLIMALVGVTSVVLLLAYGLTAAGGTPETDPLFWALAAAFVLYIGWDIRRHVRNMRSSLGPRGMRDR